MMRMEIEKYAKRLKLSWIRENYHEVEEKDPQKYLLSLFEKEVQNREERKINLLLSQAQLPKTGDQPYQWQHIQIPLGIDRETVLKGNFIQERENLILYGGVGRGKTYLATLISLNAIHTFGSINKLIDADQNGTLTKTMKQIEKLDLLVLDELGYIPLNKEGAVLLFQVISMCYESKVLFSQLIFNSVNGIMFSGIRSSLKQSLTG
jgi:DNA replication protein DnaC